MAGSKRLIVAPAVAEDGPELAERIRECDRREITATSLSEPLPAILRCIRLSDAAWTGRIDGEIAFIGGVSARSLPYLRRSPWLLGTDLLDANGLMFLRFCVRQMPDIRATLAPLENYIDARNETTRDWLAWLGFTIHPAEPRGALMRPFHRFTLEAAHV